MIHPQSALAVAAGVTLSFLSRKELVAEWLGDKGGREDKQKRQKRPDRIITARRAAPHSTPPKTTMASGT
jgi:hypothetical protein